MTRIDAIRAGDRKALAKALTLLESARPDHRQAAEALLQAAMPYAGDALRIGVSGAPGVGKSTLIESFGQHIVVAGHRLAVLSIDPSSTLTGGSILGDKTRMPGLGGHRQVYIRPSPAGAVVGGVARRTQESMLLCEAAGFDIILVETVGVGQSELRVAQMTDLFLLLLSPAGGDELQAIKRGIMELADIVVINKADSDLENRAGQTAAAVKQAFGLLAARWPDWQVPVLTVSALENRNIAAIWQAVTAYRAILARQHRLQQRRIEQRRRWLWHETREYLFDALRQDERVQQAVDELQHEVVEGRLPASVAAGRLVNIFLA